MKKLLIPLMFLAASIASCSSGGDEKNTDVSGKLADTRGTAYAEVNWNPELMPGLVLNLHAGRQQVRNMSDFNFFDVKAGVTKTFDSWAVSAAGTYNSGDASKNGTPLWTFFNADGSGKNVAQKRLVVTASRNF